MVRNYGHAIKTNQEIKIYYKKISTEKIPMMPGGILFPRRHEHVI